jgi:hypothetical protein
MDSPHDLKKDAWVGGVHHHEVLLIGCAISGGRRSPPRGTINRLCC